MCSSEYWRKLLANAETTFLLYDGSCHIPSCSRGERSWNLPSILKAIENPNRPPQVKWQNEVQNAWVVLHYRTRLSPEPLSRRDPMALHKQGTLSDQVMPIVFGQDISGSVVFRRSQCLHEWIGTNYQKLSHSSHLYSILDFRSGSRSRIDGTNARARLISHVMVVRNHLPPAFGLCQGTQVPTWNTNFHFYRRWWRIIY